MVQGFIFPAAFTFGKNLFHGQITVVHLPFQNFDGGVGNQRLYGHLTGTSLKAEEQRKNAPERARFENRPALFVVHEKPLLFLTPCIFYLQIALRGAKSNRSKLKRFSPVIGFYSKIL